MMNSLRRRIGTGLLAAACLVGAVGAAPSPKAILDAFGRESGLFVVIGCKDPGAPALAAGLGANGNSLVHAIASDAAELAAFQDAIAKANVKGCVTAEVLGLKTLPYRDHLVNVFVILDAQRAKALGLSDAEVTRCVAPYGRVITCEKGAIKQATEVPVPESMDVWTHRYHGADGVPVSNDTEFDLPVGFKWNAGLPMNFDNPVQGANRYSSTRALVLDHGCCYTFSAAVYENLGDGWRSEYGTDQYLTCRDAFNGRIIWRTKVGKTFYGGLYIENMAPLVCEGDYLFTAGENGKMLCIDAMTGKIVRELPTKYIPGVISASENVVIAATWKDGKVMGSIKHYDRRRMDWEIDQGTTEAYAADSGKLLWRNDFLGTALLIDDGRVFIVSRTEKDPLEKNHNRRKGDELKHPTQKVIAMDLKTGKILWSAEDKSFNVADDAINLEAAGHGAVAVAYNSRKSVALLSAETGKLLDAEATKKVEREFFRYRNHICTPVLRTPKLILSNRGGTIQKPAAAGRPAENVRYGGARAGCLTGTVPAYGAGYISQNWCRCSPGQIAGLLAIAPIGRVPTPEEMEAATTPVPGTAKGSTPATDPAESLWSSFRGNPERSSSVALELPTEAKVAWSKKITATVRPGTIARDWRAYLNSGITAPVVSRDIAIVGDIDHNEVIAFSVEDGSVRWRYMTGGRMDTSPTVYKGMCLVADHTGYVSALNVQSGDLLYKLRIAPEERRMVSYGKVESVWPAIGGVLVADGVAYASAGRTQGSDGGLVIRAFVPETGKQLWARALPQDGNGIIERTTKRNDALVLQGDRIIVMGHWLDAKTGEIHQNPRVQIVAKAIKAQAEKLGRQLDKKERITIEQAIDRQNTSIQVGLEGLYSWNWTRLGHRKFMSIGYGGRSGDAVSWSPNCIATCSSRGQVSTAGYGADPSKAKVNVTFGPERQVTALILSNNLLLVGGGVFGKGQPQGFVQAISLADGKVAWEQILPSKLAFNGLAVDRCGILASLDDGTVVCLK